MFFPRTAGCFTATAIKFASFDVSPTVPPTFVGTLQTFWPATFALGVSDGAIIVKMSSALNDVCVVTIFHLVPGLLLETGFKLSLMGLVLGTQSLAGHPLCSYPTEVVVVVVVDTLQVLEVLGAVVAAVFFTSMPFQQSETQQRLD